LKELFLRLFKKKVKEEMRFVFINEFPYIMEVGRLEKQMKIECLLDPSGIAVATSSGKIRVFKGKEEKRKSDYVV
jgi:hypothetical protein